MISKKTVRDIDVSGKRILVRVDFNVPLTDSGEITDDRRIKLALPTINYLLERRAKVILMSHLGRPKGQVVEKLKMDPVAERLSSLVGINVKKLNGCIGDEVEREVFSMKEGDLILLENLRFHKGETKNDPEFARKLASLGEIYVNDAFSVSHRVHASVVGVASILPAVAGLSLEKEIENLSKVKYSPEHPFVVILGGAKVSDKIELIRGLEEKTDKFLIGGGMAYTFLKAKGYDIGRSILEEDKLELAKSLLEEMDRKGKSFILPLDSLVVKSFEEPGSKLEVDVGQVPSDYFGVDVGHKTVELFKKELLNARTVLWNGPLGVFEIDDFAYGTRSIAECLAGLKDCFTVAGGGDTAAAIKKFGFEEDFSFISSGGGASLEFFGKDQLPGIAVLMDRE